MTQIEEVELKDFLTKSLEEIEVGAGDRSINGSVEFEVSVSNVTKKEGSLKVYVAEGQAERTKEKIAKIKFFVSPRPSRHDINQIAKQSEDDSIEF
ncbi:MAG: hypothetical protein UV59_C0012G0081 [Candidatus Gottesmanbacteria bacterium GW2011_GWA1_43_11]|uniref:Uncharacterized protein n=1 Tax=Candidatus Gottesmanbacteria bacterium GW2011_GWA1_43_11 TaxID=1618436 RepID=A0A0G1FDR2_9BACT|nr:MAG: hypothetical protein UV59_C0012G0081 [Candidatus Gottesmanbacteria bacterium GW2011_GWA1_43_11]